MSKKTLLKQVLFGRIQRYIWLCLLLVAFSSLSTFFNDPKKVEAATSNTMNFQARLSQSSGALVADGYYNVEFKLYSASSGGSALWTETYYDHNGASPGSDNRVRIANGYLTVNLGSQASFPNINWDQEYWLTMNIGGTTQVISPTSVSASGWDGEMTPRLKLTAVPYAFTAGKLQKTNSGNTSTLDFISPTASRSIWVPDEDGTICLQGSANCGFVTGSAANYLQNGTSPQTADFNLTGSGTLGGNLTVEGNATLGASSALTFGGDTNLYRSAANTLKTDDSLVVSGNLESNGTVLFRNTSDSSTAFQIQNAAGTSLLTASTDQMKVVVGGDFQTGSVLGSKIFTDGFESGNLNKWNDLEGNPLSSAERTRNGKYAVKLVSDSGEGSWQGIQKYLPEEYDLGTETYQLPKLLYARTYVNVDAHADTDLFLMSVASNNDEGAGTTFNVYRRISDGTLCVNYAYWNTTSGDWEDVTHCSAQVLPLDAWHRVELKVDVNESLPSIELYYDSAQIIDQALHPDAAINDRYLTSVFMGGGSDSSTMYMDDVALSDEPTGASGSAIISDDLHVGGNGSFGGGINVGSNFSVDAAGNVSIGGALEVAGSIAIEGELEASRVVADEMESSSGLLIGNIFGDNNYRFQASNLTGPYAQLGGTVSIQNGYSGQGNLLFADGFEAKNMSLWDSATGVNVSPNYNLGVRFENGANSVAELSVNNNSRVARVDIGSQSQVSLRGYFNITDHTSGDLPLLNFYNADGDRFTLYRQFSDGMLCAYNGANESTSCSSVTEIPLSEEFYLDFTLTTGPSGSLTGTYYESNSGGTSDVSLTDVGSSPITEIGFGVDNGTGVQAEYYVDNIAARSNVSGAGVATTLSVGEAMNVEGGASFAGKVLVQNTIDSTRAFQIQNAAGTSNLFIADTANTRIGIGAVPANSLLTIGTNTTNAAGGITFGTDTNLYRSAADTLQTDDSFHVGRTANDAFQVQNGTGDTLLRADTLNMRVGIGTDTPREALHVMGPDTVNNGGKGRIVIGDYCHEDDVSCSGSGTNVFIGEYYVRGSSILEEIDTDVLQLQGKSGIVLTTGYDADKINLEIGAGGGARFQNTTDSTSGFQIQRSVSAGGGNVLTADTTNTRILIGSATSPTLSTAQLVVTVAEVQTTLRVGSATNGISFNDTITGESGKLRLYGSARNIKRLVLSPEYAGAVLTQTPAACHGSDTGSGSMTAGYDGTANKNYYKWTSSQANCQSYEIVTQITLPADFDGWATGLGDYSTNDAWVSNTSNAGLYLTVLDTSGSTDVNNVNVTPGSASTWVNDGGTFAGTYAANGTMTVKFRLTAKSGASVQLGSMYFNYLSKF